MSIMTFLKFYNGLEYSKISKTQSVLYFKSGICARNGITTIPLIMKDVKLNKSQFRFWLLKKISGGLFWYISIFGGQNDD